MAKTPYAPQVMAREDSPAEFRPGNQSRLIPSRATNFSNTDTVMPGLVQSGNGYNDNGLAPKDAAAFNNSVAHMHAQMQNKMQRMQQAGSPNMAPQSITESMEQSLSAGREKPYWRQKVVIDAKERKLPTQQAVNITPADSVPLTPGMSRIMHGARPRVLTGAGTGKGTGDAMWSGQGGPRAKQIYAPMTPAPDADEPAGYNYQSDRNTLIDMQEGVSPISGLSGVLSSPMALIAAAGLGYWFFLRKG